MMATPLTTSELTRLAARLSAMPPATREAENIDRLRLLEDLKGICAAAQAREAAALDESRRAAEAARGIPAAQRGRGVPNEIALARRDGPWHGSRHLGLAHALVNELPRTMVALQKGAISEWRATIVCRETAWLPTESRTRVDELLAPFLLTLGNKALAAKARALAQSLDPAEAVRHLARAEGERHVSTRPAPDSMVYLTALLPMAQGVAAWASLDRAARTTIGTGEAGERTRNQVMADTLVERLTGQATASAVPVEVHLVMTDRALLGGHGESTSAWLVGHGPMPAGAARDLLDPRHDAPDPAEAIRVWLRRLYEHPANGQLVAMESSRREFGGSLRRMLVLRDDTCRTPWCDAPIRHADHAHPHADGGATSYENGSGLCARCNLDKETLGWRHRATADRLTVTTPTDHVYTASSPPLVRGRVRDEKVRRPTTARPPAGRSRPSAARSRPPTRRLHPLARRHGRGAPRRRRRPARQPSPGTRAV
jgi:hypothetical protein